MEFFERKYPSFFWIMTAVLAYSIPNSFSFLFINENDTRIELNSVSEQIPSLRAGDQELSDTGIGRKILYNNLFPDWPERVAYERKREKHYKSGLAKIKEQKKYVHNLDYERSLKLLTDEEKDALDYYREEGFYKEHQDLKTSPNVFDSRQSFLLKMENIEMRTKFLKTLNERFDDNN